MRKSARHAPPVAATESFLFEVGAEPTEGRCWFVYLFALADCSAFKVGFSCNPLQRICTFSRRYFEYFDLGQSLLLELPHCEAARALEAELKLKLALHRAEAPTWVPLLAGGHTEWFGAVYFGDAEARLRSVMAGQEPARVTSAFDAFRADLEHARGSFEAWAYNQAQRVCESWSSAQRGYAVKDQSGALRDWLDAYRYFDLPLFTEEPRVSEFVRQSARGPSI